MKISSAPTPRPQNRQAQLEKALEEAHGTYMYCEAADFQSAQERATSREMSKKMGELSRELAELRGDSVLSPGHLDNYLTRLETAHPLAGVAPPITQKLIPHLYAHAETLTDDVAEINDALNYKKIDKSQLDQALQERAAHRAPLHQLDDPAVLQQAAQALRTGVPKDGPDLFASVEKLAQSVIDAADAPGLSRAVAELVLDGSLPVSAQELSKGSWQCVYQQGDLGRWSERLAKEESPTRRSALAGRMATMLDHPDLEFSDPERQQATASLTDWLEDRADKARQNPYAVRSFMADLPKWARYGVDTASLTVEEWNLKP
jgi:hypothetical protein